MGLKYIPSLSYIEIAHYNQKEKWTEWWDHLSPGSLSHLLSIFWGVWITYQIASMLEFWEINVVQKNPLIYLPISSQSAEKFNLFIITLQGCSVPELLFNDTNTLSDWIWTQPKFCNFSGKRNLKIDFNWLHYL